MVVKPNTKVYWALYDSLGGVLETNVYQVPEYDAVIENSDKDIKYTVTYNDDNTLATLTVNVVNGEFSDKLYYTENGMVSNDYAGKQLFPASKSLQIDHNCNMHIILYDPFDNLITAKYVTINQIGLIPEQNFKVDVTKGDKTVYVRPRLYNVLQSRFYNIEYDVILDTFTSSKDIELHQNGVYVGKVTDTSQTHTCGSDSELKFYQSVGTSNITITFRIKNAETGVTCITRTVSFKIGLDDESTGVTDSTTNGNSDNSFITSNGSSNSGGGGYSNVSWKDITGMINTNSDFWQIVKNILSCLPVWITAPIFFFISAVVTICLTKMVLSIVGHLVG